MKQMFLKYLKTDVEKGFGYLNEIYLSFCSHSQKSASL